MEISSLSVEYVSEDHPGFVASIFEVPNDEILLHDGKVVPSRAFLEREEEFDIVQVSYQELGDNKNKNKNEGIICTRSTDEIYIDRWGMDHFEKQFKQYGIDTIWNWSHDSGMRPCAVYLRHCYLAAQGMGTECFNSFLDDTFLIDRTTTIREYLSQHGEVLETTPPPELRERYSG